MVVLISTSLKGRVASGYKSSRSLFLSLLLLLTPRPHMLYSSLPMGQPATKHWCRGSSAFEVEILPLEAMGEIESAGLKKNLRDEDEAGGERERDEVYQYVMFW